MGIFDDLIPDQPEPAASSGGGLFDDLIPAETAAPETSLRPAPRPEPEAPAAVEDQAEEPERARRVPTRAEIEGRNREEPDEPERPARVLDRGKPTRYEIEGRTREEPQPRQDLGDVGSRFARGATEVAAALPEAAAIAGAGNPNAAALFAQEEVGRAREQIALAEERLADNPQMSSESRKRIEDVIEAERRKIAAYEPLIGMAEGPLKPEPYERGLFKRGEEIREASLELFGTPDPQFDDRFISKLSEGGGSMAGFVGLTLLTGVAGGALGGAGVNASGMYRRAREDGATDEQAKAAAYLGALVGSSEVVPIGRALKMLPAKTRGKFADALGRRLSDALQTAGEEGAQEALTEISNNLIEKGLWNPEQNAFEGAGEAALIGAVLGGGLGAITSTPSDPDPERLNSPRLTEDDRKSPLPNATIDDGKAIIDDLLSGKSPAMPEAPAKTEAPEGTSASPDQPVPPADLTPENARSRGWNVIDTEVEVNGEKRRQTIYYPDTDAEDARQSAPASPAEAPQRPAGFSAALGQPEADTAPVRPADPVRPQVQTEAPAAAEPEADVLPVLDENGRETGEFVRWDAATGKMQKVAPDTPPQIDTTPAALPQAMQEEIAPSEVPAPLEDPAQAEAVSSPDDAPTAAPEAGAFQDLIPAQPKAPGKETLRKRPVAHELKTRDLSVKPGSPLAEELKTRGINARTHPGLFNSKGASDWDNLPAEEWGDYRHQIGEDGNGYLDRQGLIDALEREMRGEPVRAGVQAQLAEEQAARDAAEAEARFEAAEPDPEELDLSHVPEASVFIPYADQDISTPTERLDYVISSVDTVLRETGIVDAVEPQTRQWIIDTLNERGGNVEDAVWWNLHREADGYAEQTSEPRLAEQPADRQAAGSGEPAPQIPLGAGRPGGQPEAEGQGAPVDQDYRRADGGQAQEPAAPEVSAPEGIDAARVNLQAATAEFNRLDGEHKISDPKAYFDASLRRSKARKAYADALAEKGGRIELKSETGNGAVITPRMDGKPGARITYFDGKGISGDTHHDTLQAAVRDAVNQGYDIEAPGHMKAEKAKWSKEAEARRVAPPPLPSIPDDLPKPEAKAFPSIKEAKPLPFGPSSIPPRPIADGKPLYRETSPEALDDILRVNGQPDSMRAFVTDNRDLAIGQGDNKGIMLTFRPDSLSGEVHQKPGTRPETGLEYRTDMRVGDALAKVEIPKGMLKKLRGLSARVLKRDFDRTEAGDTVIFTRKGYQDAPSKPDTERKEATKVDPARAGAIRSINKALTPDNAEGGGHYTSGQLLVQLYAETDGDIEIAIERMKSRYKGGVKETRVNDQGTYRLSDIKDELSPAALREVESFREYWDGLDTGTEAPATERTEAGEQAVIPGAEQSAERSAEARKADQRREMEARQQQSKARTTVPQDDAGPLFDTQGDMFDAPKGEVSEQKAKPSKTQERLTKILREAWTAREDLPEDAHDEFIAATKRVQEARRALADEFGNDAANAALEEIEAGYKPKAETSPSVDGNPPAGSGEPTPPSGETSPPKSDNLTTPSENETGWRGNHSLSLFKKTMAGPNSLEDMRNGMFPEVAEYAEWLGSLSDEQLDAIAPVFRPDYNPFHGATYLGNGGIEEAKAAFAKVGVTEDAKAAQDEGPAKADDLDPKRGEAAYRNVSFNPDRRAQSDIEGYVKGVNDLYAELSELAKTDDQKAVLEGEISEYRQRYIKHMNAMWDASSRTASSMITGPARFPTARNQKRLSTYDKRVNEFLEWEKKARAAMKRRILDARPAEAKADEAWKKVEAQVLAIANDAKLAAEGGRGFDLSLFKANFYNRMHTLARSGDVEMTDRMLERLKGVHEDVGLSKPVFTARHKIWKLSDVARSAQAATEAAAQADDAIIAEYDGATITNAVSDERVRIEFDERVSRDVADALKKEGWRWSRANTAWQRKNTNAAKESAQRIVGRFFEKTDKGVRMYQRQEGKARPSQTEGGAMHASPTPVSNQPSLEGNLGLLAEKDNRRADPSKLQALLPDLKARLNKLMIRGVDLSVDPDMAEQGAVEFGPEGIEILIGNTLDGMNTVNHEAIHILRQRGLFSDAEWKALTDEAKIRWLKEFSIEDRYSDLPREAQIEEAIAEAFAAYAEGKAAQGRVKSIFAKIKRFFRAMKEALTGQGIRKAEDIFEAVERGEVGAREGRTGGEELQAVKQQRPSAAVRKLKPEGVQATAVSTHSAAIPDDTRFERFRRLVQDRMLILRRMTEATEKQTGQKIRKEEDPYFAEERYSGRVGYLLDEIEENYTKPILDLISEVSLKITDHKGKEREGYEAVSLWLMARHAKERNAHIASINDQMPDGGSGLTNAEADAILKQAGANQAVLDQIGTLTDKLGKEMITAREDAGLLSAKEAHIWRTMYKHYVPLQKFAEDDMYDGVVNDARTAMGRKYSVKGKEGQRALGRGTEAFDPLATLLTQAMEVTVRAEKNRVAKVMYNFAVRYPNPAMYEITQPETQRFYNKATGKVETRVVGPAARQLAENEMALKVDGKEYRITFKDPRLAEALGQLGTNEMGKVTSIASLFSRYFSTINTMLSPPFIIVNAFRDMMTAQVNLGATGGDIQGKLRKAALRDWVKAYRGARRSLRGKNDTDYAKWFKEYSEAGGRIHFWKVDNPESQSLDFAKRVKRASRGKLARTVSSLVLPSTRDNPALEFVETINMSVDNAVRLAAYAEARRNGWSKADAASLAKNLTVNFNRRGEIGATMNAWYPFANAAIQGSHVILKAMKSRQVQGIVGGMMLFGLANDLLAAMLSSEDEDGELEYDQLPTYISERNIIVATPFNETGYVTIPLPYGFNVFFFAGQQMGKLLRGVKSPEEAAGQVLKATVGAFSPISGESGFEMLAPTLLDFANEFDNNRDWLGRPIRPENPYGDYGPQSYKEFNASAPSRTVAQGLNTLTGGSPLEPGILDISPEYIDHFFKFMTGGAGRFAGRVYGLAERAAEGTIGETEAYEVPLARVLFAESGDFLNQNRYFEFREAVQEARAQKKLAEEIGHPMTQEMKDLNALWVSLRQAEKQRKAVREQLEAVYADESLSARERERRLKPLKERRNEVYLRFNRDFIRRMGPQAE